MLPDDILSLLDDNHGFQPCSLSILSCETALTTSAEVEDLISSHNGAQGWIARQSGVVILPGSDDLSLGAVLEAELGEPASSIQIRRLGAGWVWTRLSETAGTSHLAEDIRLVTTEGKAARYRRYWTLPADGAAEVVACRLVGLEDLS